MVPVVPSVAARRRRTTPRRVDLNGSPDVTNHPQKDEQLSLREVLSVREAPGTNIDAERRRRSKARDRALLSSLGSGAVIRILTALLSMAYFAVSVRALTQVQFGALATVATFTGVMAFADLGIGGGLMTKLAFAHGQDDRVTAKLLVSGAWTAMLVLGLLTICIGALMAHLLPWSRILGMPPSSLAEARAAFLAFGICAGLAIPANIGQRVLMASQRGTTANIWLLASTAATLTTITFMSFFRAPLWCFVVALVGTPVIFAASQSLWVLTVTYPDIRPKYGLVTRSSLWSLGQVSGLFFILNIAITFAYQCDMLIVASTLGAGAAAVFAIGLRMFGALSGVLSGASQQLWTSMAEAMSRGDMDWVRTRFIRVLAGTSAIALAGSVVLVALGRPIARVWVGDDLVPSLGLLCAFALWTVYSIVMTQISFLMNAAQIIGPQIVMALTMTVANIAISIYLTNRMGLVGPLLGSLIAHVSCSGIPAIVYMRKILRTPGDHRVSSS
jgi:O-antigen/teichoic acid export membrane protein